MDVDINFLRDGVWNRNRRKILCTFINKTKMSFVLNLFHQKVYKNKQIRVWVRNGFYLYDNVEIIYFLHTPKNE